ncbi:MAG: YkgJ family cysteine cluster protein [Candidatus Bathyarchaeia archaeon]
MAKNTERNNTKQDNPKRREKVSFEYPTNVRFECTKCGLCCGDTKEKTRHILLLTHEAEEIATYTKQPIAKFAEKTTDKTPYTYEIKKDGNGKCNFLATNNNCGIYAIRPLICRFYPFELKINKNKKHQFLYTTECPSIGKGKKLNKTYFKNLFQLAETKLQKA